MTDHKTSLLFLGDRNAPPQIAGAYAQALEASGVVDDMLIVDQLTSWNPASLWNPDNTALARDGIKDCDSFQDAFVSASFAIAAIKKKLDISITTDAIRRAPASLLQTLLTLGDGLDKPINLLLGAGEVKQTKPFGYQRKEGLGRFEDLLKITKALVETDGLVSHQGNYWNYENAWIGGAKKHPPKIHALGGGPKLFELAAKYCDGFSTVTPSAFAAPEEFAKLVKKVREDLERNDRDPDKFTFGIWYMALVDDGSHDLDAMPDNALLKFYSAALGRLHQPDWRGEGLEPVFPDDFHYAMKLLPAAMSAAEAQSIVDRTPRDMVKKAFFIGSPREVAEHIRTYAQAGANHHCIADLAQTLRPLARSQAQLQAYIETCRILKELLA